MVQPSVSEETAERRRWEGKTTNCCQTERSSFHCEEITTLMFRALAHRQSDEAGYLLTVEI